MSIQHISKLVVVKRALGALCITLALGSTVASSGLYNSYMELPRHPDSKLQRMIPYEIKNRIVYLTEQENDRLNWVERVEFGSYLGFLLLYYFFGNPFK